MPLIDDILTSPELADRPPVLVDIGAAGRLNPRWRPFARYSIGIAFDPDPREMGYIESAQRGYRKLIVVPRIATERDSDELDFHLAREPQCSSTLAPDTASVERFLIADYFTTKETTRLPATTLDRVLTELKLPGAGARPGATAGTAVDWFKTDSQGTDLRLFESLGADRMARTRVAEFEPGIIDCYRGEDLLADVMKAMAGRGFVMTGLRPRGPRRLRPSVADRHFTGRWRRLLEGLLPAIPGWASVVYVNELAEDGMPDRRTFLLAWVFATVLGQHGLALEFADRGRQLFDDGLFDRMIRHTKGRIRRRVLAAAPWLGRQLARRLLKPSAGE